MESIWGQRAKPRYYIATKIVNIAYKGDLLEWLSSCGPLIPAMAAYQ